MKLSQKAKTINDKIAALTYRKASDARATVKRAKLKNRQEQQWLLDHIDRVYTEPTAAKSELDEQLRKFRDQQTNDAQDLWKQEEDNAKQARGIARGLLNLVLIVESLAKDYSMTQESILDSVRLLLKEKGK